MSASIDDIRFRILAIAASYGNPPLGTNIALGEDIRLLPAYTCIAANATWQTISTQRYLVTRNYELWVYVTEIGKGTTDETVVREAINDCAPWIVGLASFYSKWKRLELPSTTNGVVSDNALVADCGDVSDSGPAQTPLRTKIYSAFRLVIPVITYAP